MVPFRAQDKWQALAALAELPARAGVFSERLAADVHQALVLRERSMTTGMEHGIAIPHAAVDGIDMIAYGHSDLSARLGVHLQLEHPTFKAAVRRCRVRWNAAIGSASSISKARKHAAAVSAHSLRSLP
mgnify:CR=1 FL=1